APRGTRGATPTTPNPAHSGQWGPPGRVPYPLGRARVRLRVSGFVIFPAADLYVGVACILLRRFQACATLAQDSRGPALPSPHAGTADTSGRPLLDSRRASKEGS